MKKVLFTLQDAPDYALELDVDIQPNKDGEYSVSEEIALALLIYDRFPKLKECNRRIKKLIVIDEEGSSYESNDFDIIGSLTKISE